MPDNTSRGAHAPPRGSTVEGIPVESNPAVGYGVALSLGAAPVSGLHLTGGVPSKEQSGGPGQVGRVVWGA